MKTLKFAPELVELIKNGSKTVTWRLFDDKDIQVNDELTFIKRPELIPFATALVTDVSTKPLKDISPQDMLGHEYTGSTSEMYQKYTEYYKQQVTPETEVKVIRYKITSFL